MLDLRALQREHGSERESIARAVATTLFGSPGAPDDDTSDDNGFFLSESHEPFNVYEDALLQYYNPERLYLDTVLSTRRGVPLATSLIALEACSQLGLHMVGLRSPTALLLRLPMALHSCWIVSVAESSWTTTRLLPPSLSGSLRE